MAARLTLVLGLVLGGCGGENGDGMGTPVMLVSAEILAHSIAIDRTHVYWTERYDRAVKKVPIEGGSIGLVASGIQGIWDIAVDGTSVYFSQSVRDGVVERVGLDGGARTVLATGLHSPRGLAVDVMNLYVAVGGAFEAPTGQLLRIPLAGGGSTTTIASEQWLPNDVVVDGDAVYWTNLDAGTVMKAPIAGGEPVMLASEQARAQNLVVDGGYVYWTTLGVAEYHGTVMKVPTQGGSPTMLAANLNGPTAIAVDGRYVYWVDAFAKAVFRLSIDGGTPTVIASQQEPFDIVVDDQNIYWTTATSIVKMAKPR
jgi:hypothetical protein